MTEMFMAVCVFALVVFTLCAAVVSVCLVRLTFGEREKCAAAKEETEAEKREREMQEARDRIFNEGMANIFGYDIHKARGGDGE